MIKKDGFYINRGHKQQRRLSNLTNLTSLTNSTNWKFLTRLTDLTNFMNPKTVCFYHYSCLDLPMEIFDCWLGDCPFLLHLVCQGGYAPLYDIYFEVGEKKTCHDCVGKLGGGSS